ncbi:MAG: hypothetical protein NTU69_13055 [Proteobacteria bacterium]|nr:hypothetical protein [Pseudomonadota bacterium]
MNQNNISGKTSQPGDTPRYRYTDIVLIVVGLVVTFLGTYNPIFTLIGIILSGIGLGIWAKRTGRSIIGWVLIALIPIIGPMIGLGVMWARREGPPVTVYPERRNITPHVVAAFIIFLVFAVVIDSLGIIFAFLVALMVIALKRVKSEHPVRMKLIAIGIYTVMLVCAIALKAINNQVSLRNASVIIAACEQYKTKKGVYPDRLNNLVPEYLSKVPVARYSGITGWTYFHHSKKREDEGDYYTLQYSYESLFGRRFYNSETKQWRSMD